MLLPYVQQQPNKQTPPPAKTLVTSVDHRYHNNRSSRTLDSGCLFLQVQTQMNDCSDTGFSQHFNSWDKAIIIIFIILFLIP
jgi:hypothetical protein